MPVWGAFLSEPLGIVGLVGRYPANCLMPRMPIPRRRSFPPTAMRPPVTCGISTGFPVLSPCGGQVAYALLTSAPVAAGVLPHRDAPRLACVKPAASVHPEPGSNSPLFYLFHSLFLCYLQHGAPMPGFVSLTEGFRPLPYTSSFVSKRLLLHSLNVLFLTPREGADCKDRESFRDTQLRDAFFFEKKSRAEGLPPGDAPRSRFACAKVRTSRRTRKRGEDFFQDGETGSDARCYATPRYDKLKNVKKEKKDRHPPLKTKKRGTLLI